MNLTAKSFQSERPLQFFVLQINDKRGKEGRKEAFSRIFALASSSAGTQTFFHESRVLDASGLAVPLNRAPTVNISLGSELALVVCMV